MTLRQWQAEEAQMLPGFGLLPEEVEAKTTVRPKGKRHRMDKPVPDWTHTDVTAEFLARLTKAAPATAGFIPLVKSSIVLAQTRNRLRTTPEVEMALMDLWFADDRNLQRAIAVPSAAFRMWLDSWKRMIPRAREVVGLPPLALPSPADGPYSRSSAPVDSQSAASAPQPAARVLVASDGAEFPASVAGRAFLASYEADLRAKA